MSKKLSIAFATLVLALCLGALTATADSADTQPAELDEIAAADATSTSPAELEAAMCLDQTAEATAAADFICIPNIDCSSDFECGANGWCSHGKCDCR